MENGSTPRLSPETWVNAAYEAFEDGGVAAVRVDPLAKRLGVTRGSFYWHFKDRGALLRAVIERWARLQTERVIEANEAGGGEPAERLLRLLRTCASDDGRFETGVREWAKTDEAASGRVREIDRRRIDYMTALAVAAGTPEDVARSRSRVGYLAWLGSYTAAAPGDAEQRSEDIECLWRMMLDR